MGINAPYRPSFETSYGKFTSQSYNKVNYKMVKFGSSMIASILVQGRALRLLMSARSEQQQGAIN